MNYECLTVYEFVELKCYKHGNGHLKFVLQNFFFGGGF